jgi:hypothetical protein
MNQDQLELALEQARKMERNGKFWTAVGAGMLVGGSVEYHWGMEWSHGSLVMKEPT